MMKHLTELLDEPATPALVVVITTSGEGVAELLAGQLQAGKFSLVAGHERRLPAYEVAKILHWRRANIKKLFSENLLARAPTCFQLVDILQRAGAISDPLLVTDFLYTFYDADLRLDIRWQVFRRCLSRLQLLARFRRVTVIIRDGEGEDFDIFFPSLERAANELLRVEPEGRQAIQLGLI